MNDLEKHIKNLEEYCEDDRDFRSQTAEEEKSDFDIFCDNHIADIEAVLTAYEKEKEKNKNAIDFINERKKIVNTDMAEGTRLQVGTFMWQVDELLEILKGMEEE